MKTRADAIIELFNKNDKIAGAEIGVYKGNLSRMLLEAMPKLTLYMIDRWQAYSKDEMIANENSSMSLRDQKTFDMAYEKAKLIRDKYYERVFIFYGCSLNASFFCKDNKLDFVFIDADHSYDAIINDIQVWLPKIKKGGYICGHDYHRESVKNAVHNMFYYCDVTISYDNTWIVRT